VHANPHASRSQAARRGRPKAMRAGLRLDIASCALRNGSRLRRTLADHTSLGD
jgi:hypothetical protein